jgi:hypothetical protein
MMLYAVGSGARGLVSYIHCSEKTAGWIGHGTGEFPDLWCEVGRTYRSLAMIAELLLVAHPLRIESDRPDRLWVSTLLAGPEAMVIVVVNDNYTSRADVFEQTPAQSIQLRVACPPWLEARRAVCVRNGQAEPIAMRRDGKELEVRLDRIEAGEILLICRDPGEVDRLVKEFERQQARLAAALLANRRQGLEDQAVVSEQTRLIPFRYARYAAEGKGIGGYGISRSNLWNPNRETYNTLEYWEGKGNSRMGVSWGFDIPAGRAGKPHTFYWMGSIWGSGPAAGKMMLRDAAGKVMASTLIGLGSERVKCWTITPPTAGKYTIELVQDHEGEKGGRIAKVAYFVPEGGDIAPYAGRSDR